MHKLSYYWEQIAAPGKSICNNLNTCNMFALLTNTERRRVLFSFSLIFINMFINKYLVFFIILIEMIMVDGLRVCEKRAS